LDLSVPATDREHFDQSGEVIGQHFVDAFLRHPNIHPLLTTVKNPQANAICERLHQTVTKALRPSLHAHHPPNADESSMKQLNKPQLTHSALQTAAYSARAAIHSSLLKITPGDLVFKRDMILLPFQVQQLIMGTAFPIASRPIRDFRDRCADFKRTTRSALYLRTASDPLHALSSARFFSGLRINVTLPALSSDRVAF
jgi:hypothetical protein